MSQPTFVLLMVISAGFLTAFITFIDNTTDRSSEYAYQIKANQVERMGEVSAQFIEASSEYLGSFLENKTVEQDVHDAYAKSLLNYSLALDDLELENVLAPYQHGLIETNQAELSQLIDSFYGYSDPLNPTEFLEETADVLLANTELVKSLKYSPKGEAND